MTNEETIKILKGAIKKPNTKDGYLGQAIDMAIKALEEQKTGEWVEIKIDNLNSIFDGCVKDRRCSVCDYHSATKTKYCPNCGAKMEVKANEPT